MLNKYFNKKTPIILPKTPPNSSIKPIKKSTLALLICAKKPETDAAKIWFASDATATAGGIPIKINMGVIRKPPPTPNIPDKKPTTKPKHINTKKLIGRPAIGK